MKAKANLFYAAAMGWLLLLVIHLFSIAGIDVMEKIPVARVLYIVIFIVWVPAILQLKKNEALKQYSRKEMQGRQNSFGMPGLFFSTHLNG